MADQAMNHSTLMSSQDLSDLATQVFAYNFVDMKPGMRVQHDRSSDHIVMGLFAATKHVLGASAQADPEPRQVGNDFLPAGQIGMKVVRQRTPESPRSTVLARHKLGLHHGSRLEHYGHANHVEHARQIAGRRLALCSLPSTWCSDTPNLDSHLVHMNLHDHTPPA
jgi:hypothetical protein